jgi:hypothetical protein
VKRIIGGKWYNTKTAVYVCDVSPAGFYGNDFRAEDTGLYRTPKGAWFLAGRGGPLSRWASREGQSGYCSGSGICPLDKEEARELLERHGSAEDVEQYARREVTMKAMKLSQKYWTRREAAMTDQDTIKMVLVHVGSGGELDRQTIGVNPNPHFWTGDIVEALRVWPLAPGDTIKILEA